ncbi:hypothetical protein [Thermosediminibacter oceani]|uniref:Uncharacterized protein n=1 Tax=Thermosediminibacter oceani (strain ATCC BAA-1034 / DSM 16646 / JW/IW-1228P) TaxID=555079 RepID=D9S298_THEOJ|nr:hypothetical protein [Thermosediminibacter oceani]ADL07525.1 hypothetical protein Toce_0759 [Thermosediminibacter oceani DSM 16646]
MSFTRDLVDGLYRQDKYSLVYLLLMTNVLSLAVFLSKDAGLKSVSDEFNAGEREKPAISNNPPVEQPLERAVAAAASGGIEVPVPEKPAEKPQKDKVIDLEKVRSKPLVWRFPNN